MIGPDLDAHARTHSLTATFEVDNKSKFCTKRVTQNVSLYPRRETLWELPQPLNVTQRHCNRHDVMLGLLLLR